MNEEESEWTKKPFIFWVFLSLGLFLQPSKSEQESIDEKRDKPAELDYEGKMGKDYLTRSGKKHGDHFVFILTVNTVFIN